MKKGGDEKKERKTKEDNKEIEWKMKMEEEWKKGCCWRKIFVQTRTYLKEWKNHEGFPTVSRIWDKMNKPGERLYTKGINE